MTSFRTRKPAFTLVEVLVVISIIGLLLALLLPALGGVKRKNYKTRELNAIKQVSQAWMLYANHSNDAAVPGFLDDNTPQGGGAPGGVHARWKVKYEYPDHKPIPPAPTPPATNYSGPNIAGPWTWRLLSYLDYSHELIHDYANEVEDEMFNISANPQAALKIAEEPAFGYNGYYLGGYWRMQNVGGGTLAPRYDFTGYRRVPTSSDASRSPLAVPTTIGQVRRSAELISFCSSTRITGAGIQNALPDDTPGGHLVVPPFLATDAQWAPDPQGSIHKVNVLASTATFVPLQRYTGAAAVLYVDGHTDVQTYIGLNDQRKWIDSASERKDQYGP